MLVLRGDFKAPIGGGRMTPHPANPTIAERREGTDTVFIIVVVVLLAAGAVFTAGMNYGMELGYGDAEKEPQAQVDSAIEDAQLQISDAIYEADKFRRSLEC